MCWGSGGRERGDSMMISDIEGPSQGAWRAILWCAPGGVAAWAPCACLNREARHLAQSAPKEVLPLQLNVNAKFKGGGGGLRQLTLFQIVIIIMGVVSCWLTGTQRACAIDKDFIKHVL